MEINIPDNATFSIVYEGRTEGYDGHSLRAHSYFGEQMPDILIHETGKAYMITFEDGSTELLHESHPDLEKYRQQLLL